MKILVNKSVNWEELVEVLKKCDFQKMDDDTLYLLGLKIRFALNFVNQSDKLTEKQKRTMQEVRYYQSVVEKEMSDRGYDIVNYDELSQLSSDEIEEIFAEAPFELLVEWYCVLFDASSKEEEDERILAFVAKELARRSIVMSGGKAN